MLMADGNRGRPILVFELGLHYTSHEFVAMWHAIHQLQLKSHLESNQITYKVLHLVLSMLSVGNSFQFLNKIPFLPSFLYHNWFVVQFAVLLVTYLHLLAL